MNNLQEIWDKSEPIEDLSSAWEQAKPTEQPKIGALKKSPQFSEKPYFMGEAVGSPTMSAAHTALDVLNTPFVPLQEILRSNVTTTAEDPFADLRGKGLSPLDIAGRASRGLLQQGGATESLPQDITKPENFGDVAETLGRVIAEYGAIHPYVVGISQILSGATKAGRTAANFNRQIRNVVEARIPKMIRLGKRGKKSFSDYELYMDRATEASVDIVRNKKNLILTDKNGMEIRGKRPENLKQMAQAINQGLKKWGRKIEEPILELTGQQAMVNTSKIADRVESMATEGLQVGDRAAYNYAIKEAERLRQKGAMTPKDILDAVKATNNKIRGALQSGKKGFTMSGRGYVEYQKNVFMREALDAMVESLKGTKWQPIRDKYAAYKAIEEDTINRLIVHARKNKYGLMDLMDVFSGYHAVKGVLTFDPVTMTAAASSKLISIGQKLAVNPNRYVKSMFRDVEKILNKRDALIAPPKPVPIKPAPKQLGWDGTFTRSGSGTPIELRQGEQYADYKPPPLMRPSQGKTKSTIPRMAQRILKTEHDVPQQFIDLMNKAKKAKRPNIAKKLRARALYEYNKLRVEHGYKPFTIKQIERAIEAKQKSAGLRIDKFRRSKGLKAFIGKDGRIKLSGNIR